MNIYFPAFLIHFVWCNFSSGEKRQNVGVRLGPIVCLSLTQVPRGRLGQVGFAVHVNVMEFSTIERLRNSQKCNIYIFTSRELHSLGNDTVCSILWEVARTVKRFGIHKQVHSRPAPRQRSFSVDDFK